MAKPRYSADLVVDASGRGSRLPDWLVALGYAPPEETVVNSFVGYATRLFEPPPQFDATDHDVHLSHTAVLPRGGSITQLETRWIVTMPGGAGLSAHRRGRFMAFARSLATPLLYEALKDARPCSPIHGYRQMANQWRHYERLARWPTPGRPRRCRLRL